MRTNKKVGRKLVASKVNSYLLNRKYTALPTLLLEGRKLESAGFMPGDRVEIFFLTNQIIIRKEVVLA